MLNMAGLVYGVINSHNFRVKNACKKVAKTCNLVATKTTSARFTRVDFGAELSLFCVVRLWSSACLFPSWELPLLACLPPPLLHFMKQLSYFTSCLLPTTTLPLSTNLSCHYENSAPLLLCTPASGNWMAPLWTWTVRLKMCVSWNRRREMSDCSQVTAAQVAR